MSEVIKLTKKLIQLQSISPNDGGCQKIIIKKLQSLNFNIETFPLHNTMNLWAYRGKEPNVLVLAGHTDTVPPGDSYAWKFPPFSGTIKNNILYGRGAADMKGSLSAMIIASERFLIHNPEHKGKLAFLITSDEEGNGKYGTKKIIKKLISRKEKIDYCLIGEPTSNTIIGDIIKNGRRGSLTAKIKIFGTQGHVAYSESKKNPIHLAITRFLNTLISIQWDSGSNIFPKTTMQITKINSGICSNMIPHQLTAECNFRFNILSTKKKIQKKVHDIMNYYNLTYEINWILSAQPYFSPPGKLTDIVVRSIKNYQKIIPKIETSGGTSDGRFIAKTGAEIIEFGVCNKTIHKINEHINIKDLEQLTKIYEEIIKNTLSS